MLKKIALITLASLALGGCTLTNFLSTNKAATDASNTPPTATMTPVPMQPGSVSPSPILRLRLCLLPQLAMTRRVWSKTLATPRSSTKTSPISTDLAQSVLWQCLL